MPYISSPRVQLHYRWDGPEDAPVMILSHSLGATLDMWSPQLAEFTRHFRVLRYDQRGHGQSGMPARPWTIADFGMDARDLMDKLEVERAHFCGISLGGMAGLWMAQHAPERLRSLVLANTSAFTMDPSLLRGRMEKIERDGMPGIVDGILERWFTAGFRERHPEVVRPFREGILATPAASYLATSAAICDLDLRAGLRNIAVPTLVITGTHDLATPPAWGETITAGIPRAKLRELDAAHLSNVEAAAEFNAAVVGFAAG